MTSTSHINQLVDLYSLDYFEWTLTTINLNSPTFTELPDFLAMLSMGGEIY